MMENKNTFEAYDVYISFKTNKSTNDDAWNELCKVCERNGIEIIEGLSCALFDKNGKEILE